MERIICQNLYLKKGDGSVGNSSVIRSISALPRIRYVHPSRQLPQVKQLSLVNSIVFVTNDFYLIHITYYYYGQFLMSNVQILSFHRRGVDCFFFLLLHSIPFHSCMYIVTPPGDFSVKKKDTVIHSLHGGELQQQQHRERKKREIDRDSEYSTSIRG